MKDTKRKVDGQIAMNMISQKACRYFSVSQALSSMTKSSTYHGTLAFKPILNSTYERIGMEGDSGFTPDGSVFVTEKNSESLLASAGDYFIDYISGRYHVIAGATATPTVTYYIGMDVSGISGSNGKLLDILEQNAAFGTSTKGLPIFGKYEATPTSYTDGDAVPILLDANGHVQVDVLSVTEGRGLQSEQEVTVVTAGTPVALPDDSDAKEVMIINNNVDGTIIAVGLAATVDAVSTPPVGIILTAYDYCVLPISSNSNELSVDASGNGKKATIHIYH